MSIPEPQGLGSALNCESPEDLLSIRLPVVWPKLAKHPRLDYPVLTPKGSAKYLLFCLTSFLDAAHITLLIPHSSGSKINGAGHCTPPAWKTYTVTNKDLIFYQYLLVLHK